MFTRGQLRGFNLTMSRDSHILFAVVQYGLIMALELIFESVVIGLTLYHTWSLAREQARLNLRGGGGIVKAILRNGTYDTSPYNHITCSP
jgi:hypothetical protein